LICFDELTHFTAHQFFYLLSRNRSTLRCQALTFGNLQPGRRQLGREFLHGGSTETGFSDPERPGSALLRPRLGEIVWADQPENLMQHLRRRRPFRRGSTRRGRISVHVPSRPRCSTTPRCCRSTPEYLAWLLSLPLLESERLLGGNWKVRRPPGSISSAMVCRRRRRPGGSRRRPLLGSRRDRENRAQRPGLDVGIKLGRDKNGGYWLLDMVRKQAIPATSRDCCSILPRKTASGSVSFRQGSGTGRKSQALHWCAATQCLHCNAGQQRVATSSPGSGRSARQCRVGNVKIPARP